MSAAFDRWIENHGEWIAGAFALLFLGISANWI